MKARPRRSSPLLAALSAAVLVVVLVPGAPAAGPGPAASAAGWAKRGLDHWPGRTAGRRLLVRFRRGIERGRARASVASWGGELAGRVPLVGADVVRVPEGLSVGRALARLEDNPLVAHAEPDHLVYAAAPPGDPRFDQQWGLRNTGQAHPVTGAPGTVARGRAGADIRAVPAWDGGGGGPGPVIAVVDSGVDVGHPDLAGNLWVNQGETDNGVDDDGNGLVDDINGWDFARGRAALLESRPYIGWNHGTHVAGIAVAESNNGEGIVGVCPSCRVMALKFMRPVDTNGDNRPDTMVGSLSAELRALDYAADMGASVVNASFGSIVWSSLERRAYAQLGRRGVLSVVAAGNENGDNDMYLFADFDDDGIPDSVSPAYPATYDLDSILSVAASNHGDRYGFSTRCARARGSARWPCTFTNWGHDSVDVAAPGVDIVSTVPTAGAGGYQTFDGTSMAAPHVAGLAGLVWSERGGLSALEVKRVIMASAARPAGLDRLYALPGLSPRHGGFTRTNGRIDAAGALQAAPPARAPRSDGDVKGARPIARERVGKVRWPRDVNDVYKKRLRAGRAYEVVLDASRRVDLDLVIYKPGAKEIWQIERGCFVGRGKCKLVAYPRTRSGDETVRFRARKRGFYFFQVSSFFSTGRYTLRVRRPRP